MKHYLNPEIEMVIVSEDDVIATSGLTEAVAFGFGSDDKQDIWDWSC